MLLVLASTSSALSTYVPRVINAQSDFLIWGTVSKQVREIATGDTVFVILVLWQSFHALMVTLAFTV